MRLVSLFRLVSECHVYYSKWDEDNILMSNVELSSLFVYSFFWKDEVWHCCIYLEKQINNEEYEYNVFTPSAGMGIA